MTAAPLELFAREYACHRAEEGRAYNEDQLLELPYVKTGPHAGQWAVRAKSFEAFISQVLRPAAAQARRPLTVLDLGAGNAWLSYRVVLEGHRAIALDIRDDFVDGLGAAEPFLRRTSKLKCIVAPFDAVPLPAESADITLFNASLHYATDLQRVLLEAKRVTRRGGRIVVLDSPFYRREADGEAMIAQKRARFGPLSAVLMSLPFIEFLTLERLNRAVPELAWSHHKVRYPLSYELRPLSAAIRRRRRPSRFDLWIAQRP